MIELHAGVDIGDYDSRAFRGRPDLVGANHGNIPLDRLDRRPALRLGDRVIFLGNDGDDVVALGEIPRQLERAVRDVDLVLDPKSSERDLMSLEISAHPVLAL